MDEWHRRRLRQRSRLFAAPHSPTQIGRELPLRELAPPGQPLRLCIDGDSLTFFLSGPRWGPYGLGGEAAPAPSHCGGEYAALASAAAAFVAALRNAGCSDLLVVFDPGRLAAPASLRKLSAWASRLERSTASAGALHSLLASRASSPPGPEAGAALDATPPPELNNETLRRALSAAGARVVASLAAEADDTLVALVRSGACHAVLSADSDFGAAEGCAW